MEDEDIDLSDLPEISPQEFAHGLVRQGLRPLALKAQITLRIDSDVIAWFRSRGAGYQSQMNAVLKAYKEAHEDRHRSDARSDRKGSAKSDVLHDDQEFPYEGAGEGSLSGPIGEEPPSSPDRRAEKRKR